MAIAEYLCLVRMRHAIIVATNPQHLPEQVELAGVSIKCESNRAATSLRPE